jgi:hypothetical protein
MSAVTRDELVSNLEYLINKYVRNDAKRSELLIEISRRDFFVAKGVLVEINKSGSQIEQIDSDLIKEIAFNFA